MVAPIPSSQQDVQPCLIYKATIDILEVTDLRAGSDVPPGGAAGGSLGSSSPDGPWRPGPGSGGGSSDWPLSAGGSGTGSSLGLAANPPRYAFELSSSD
nr:unnamed protein product [Digitaria exilis]